MSYFNFLNLQNISNFNKTSDYLPIITAALIVDMFIIFIAVLKYINVKSLNDWYNKFGFMAVLADVLSIVIGIIIARFIYPFIFTEYSLIKFLLITCIVQIIHDLLFAKFFYTIPRNNSKMLDVFKDYGNELGPKILLVDSLMMISTVIISSYLATLNLNITIITLIISLYILPYLLYSIN